MREIIAVDIDDVINPSLDTFIAFQNEHYGTQLTREHFMHKDDYWGYYERALGRAACISMDESTERYEQFKASVEIDTLSVPEATKIGINGLKRWVSLQVVTARDYSSRDRTEAWLDRHFPDAFDAVHFNRAPDGERTKAEVCQEIGATRLIDDAPEHCNIAAEAGISPILFGEYGWNVHEETHPTVVRAANWQEVLHFLGKSYKKP